MTRGSLSAVSFAETWKAVPGNVPAARRAVVGWLRAMQTTDPPLGEIEVVLAEALNNAVMHAYAGDPPGEVRVRVVLHPREVEVVVEDDGRGMLPRPDSRGLGLGLPLIAMLSERLDVASEPGAGTRVSTTFLREAPR